MSKRQTLNSVPDAAARSAARWKRFVRSTVWIVLVPYLSVTAMLGLLQRTLIYFPTREARMAPEEAGLPTGQVHTITTQTEDGVQLHGWHVLPEGHAAEDREQCNRDLQTGRWLVLFFGGNGANRSYRGPEFRVFTGLGAHVFIFDYRGYGENAGAPTEAGLAADARTVWRYATEERNVPPERIILYGESLGGAVAVRLAAELCQVETPPSALVVRSTFSSLTDVGAYHYPWLPVRWLLLDRFASEESIRAITCPYLQLHGDRDGIVPIHLGRQLFRAAPDRSASGLSKQFVTLPGADHNDVLLAAKPEFRSAVASFLERVHAEPDKPFQN